MEINQIQHLYWRAGFGISPNEAKELSNLSKAEVLQQLFKASKYNIPLEIDLSEFDSIVPIQLFKNPKKISAFQEKSKEKIKLFNVKWVERLGASDAVLREKMTLFWANHFACQDTHILHVQQFNNAIRAHALENFGDLVKLISKEASMIKYLNNKQNKKEKPNENFARELMELFTLGIGHYTEEDVKESARAFTGYDHNFWGEFQFKSIQHDYQFKSFFGSRGRYDGDDIIDLILKKEQCAKFICEKIYKYFVNDIINENHVNEMVKVFYPNYEIQPLMFFVFNSHWFYESYNVGVKIKSPIELIVGMQKVVPFKFNNRLDIIKIQRLLGQLLLFPPNVAGWKGGKSWIDTNTIMLRLRLPSVLLNYAIIPNNHEGYFVDTYKQKYIKKYKEKLPFKTKTDWSFYDNNFSTIDKEEIKQYIIQTSLPSETLKYLESRGTKSKRDICLQLMSIPEYQMC